MDAVVVDEAVEELAVEGGGAVDAFASGPPEGLTVGVGVGLPQDCDGGGLERFEGGGELVNLGGPVVVEVGSRGEELLPFEVGELGVEALGVVGG